MANPNIFMQALQPVRSVADYTADMDEADARRQRNALQALVLDQTQRNSQYEQQQRQQQQIAQAKLAALLQASGGDDTRFAGALRSSGDPALWAKAGEVEKGVLERRNTQSQIAERDAKTAKETSDMQAARRKDAVLRIGMAATPEHAAAIINSESDIPMQHRTQMLQTLQQHASAGKFVDWKLLVALGAMNAEQQGKAMTPEYKDAGGQMVNVNPMAQGSPIQKTPTFADRTAAGNLKVAQDRLAFDQGRGEAEAGGPGQAALVKKFGKPSPGFRWKQDGSMEAIPGGPADIKAGAEGEKRATRQQVLSEQAASVLGEIAAAKKLTGYGTAGFAGVAANLPMTDARKLAGHLETIKANLGFDRLQQMRDMSPTGGALGQVAVQELVALRSTVAMLDQLQSPSDVISALDKIEKHYKKWESTLRQGGASESGGEWGIVR